MEPIFYVINALVNASTGPLLSNLVNIISSSPGLLLFVLIPFVGLGIGLIKRIIKLN